MRDIPWTRNVLPAVALSLLLGLLQLANGVSPQAVALNSLWIALMWFVVIGALCVWRVRRDGVVVFAEAGWRRRR